MNMRSELSVYALFGTAGFSCVSSYCSATFSRRLEVGMA